MDPIQVIYQEIVEGNQKAAKAAVQTAIDAGIPADTILTQGMIAAMAEVGRLFEQGEYFVPEMLVSAKSMQEGLNLLRPLLVAQGIEPIGKVVMGTVKGDLHDIGKNLVGMMLEGAGFEVIDLGTDTAPEKFIEAVNTHQAHLLGMSAMLTTTMGNMRHVISALEAAGLRSSVQVMVGGAPLTENFAQQIGADGYAPDASRAVDLAKRLLDRVD
jgi:5-methyltetrahydrofolate--homocysteine methyltransferase